MTFIQQCGNFPAVHSVFEKNGNNHYLTYPYTSNKIQQLVSLGVPVANNKQALQA